MTYWINRVEAKDGKAVLHVSNSPSTKPRAENTFLFGLSIPVPELETDATAVLLIDGNEYELDDKFCMPLRLSDIPSTDRNGELFFTPRKPICTVNGPDRRFISRNLPRD